MSGEEEFFTAPDEIADLDLHVDETVARWSSATGRDLRTHKGGSAWPFELDATDFADTEDHVLVDYAKLELRYVASILSCEEDQIPPGWDAHRALLETLK